MTAPKPEAIPAELRALKRWVLWRLEDVGRPKKAKVPYGVHGRRAKTTDERDWATFDEALAAIGGYDGVGFVFTQTPYVGVDLDGAVTGAGLSNTAIEFVAALPGAYQETSQSGRGVHLIVRGQLPPGGRRKDDVEMYDATSPRYFALTGDLLNPFDRDRAAPLPDATPALAVLHARHIGAPEASPTAAAPKDDKAIDDAAKALVESARAGREARRFFGLFDAGEFYEGKRSEADFDLAKILWRQPGAAEDAVVEAMAASALYRDKWGEKRGPITLLRWTVQKARPGGGAGLAAEANRSATLAELEADPEVHELPRVLAPRLAWANRTTLFAGREKWAGKSTILTAAAAAFTAGRPFLGEPTGGPGPVLWVSADLEPKADVFQRAKRFKADPALFRVMYPRATTFEARMDELEAELLAVRPAWLVVDTLAHFAFVEDPGQASGWIEALLPLRRAAQAHGAAVTLVHHTPKSAPDEYRDSTAIGGIVDQIVIYKTPDRTKAVREVVSIGRIVGAAMEWSVELKGDAFAVGDAKQSAEARALPAILAAAARPNEPAGWTSGRLADAIHDACEHVGIAYGAAALVRYVDYAIATGALQCLNPEESSALVGDVPTGGANRRLARWAPAPKAAEPAAEPTSAPKAPRARPDF